MLSQHPRHYRKIFFWWRNLIFNILFRSPLTVRWIFKGSLIWNTECMLLYRVPFFDCRQFWKRHDYVTIYKCIGERGQIGMRAKSNVKYKHQSFRRYQCKVHTSINDGCPREGYSISCVVCNVISINYTSNKALETYSYISWTSTYFLCEIFHNGVFYTTWKRLTNSSQ